MCKESRMSAAQRGADLVLDTVAADTDGDRSAFNTKNTS